MEEKIITTSLLVVMISYPGVGDDVPQMIGSRRK